MAYIGIDAGGTLIKIAIMDQERLTFIKHPISQINEVAAWITDYPAAKICITGGKAASLRSLIGRHTSEIVEFEASTRGVVYFMDKYEMKESAYIITNVGTGTSIHYVNNGQHLRVGGTGIGGGTLLGLSELLTGLKEYDVIVQTALRGHRDRIDLKVSHIYENAVPPIPGDLTASNFGHILRSDSQDSYTNEDLLASVIGMVGETVATVSVLAAGQFGITKVIFIGSSFIQNELLKEIVQRYTVHRGAQPIFLEDGQYSGAVGAMMYAGDKQ